MARPTSEANRTLGKRVKERRNELGISQEALAHRCGVHWTFLGQVERGQRNPRLSNLLKIAAGLDIDPGELVSGLKPPAQDESPEQSRP